MNIDLVSEDYYGRVGYSSPIFDGLNPSQHIFEAVSTCVVEHNHKPARSLEVAPLQTVETVQAGCVKNLQKHHISILSHYFFICDIIKSGLLIAIVKGFVNQSPHNAALADF